MRDSAAEALVGEDAEVRRAAEDAKTEDKAARREVIALMSGSLAMDSLIATSWRGFKYEEAEGAKAWMLLKADRHKTMVAFIDLIMVQVLF